MNTILVVILISWPSGAVDHITKTPMTAEQCFDTADRFRQNGNRKDIYAFCEKDGALVKR